MNLRDHPCFNEKVKGNFVRVYLPVAPICNIRCNYCNQRYDCVNESLPGVTNREISPNQAFEYLKRAFKNEASTQVAGIIGPGDPSANPEATLKTLRLAREGFPDLILCLAANGPGLLD
ncbi:MAG: radical SAM protein, partial [Desulfosarcina sp.]|nr:radical SAM protein [Desulfobacterales bacterium]